MKSEEDISDTLVAKSLQLNADDLIAGPIVVKIIGVKRNADEKQPIAIEIEGRMPFIPCKTMRRVLCKAWGTNAKMWLGRFLKLYRDPNVIYAGKPVGGIRISAMSDIEVKFEVALSEVRGSKKMFVVDKLDAAKQTATPTKPAAQQVSPVAAMFAAWKEAREMNHRPADDVSLRAFVESATGGAIKAEDARRSASYTPQLIAVCMTELSKLLPPGDSGVEEEIPFAE